MLLQFRAILYKRVVNIAHTTKKSSFKKLFVIPPVFTKSYGERSFAHTASTLWNNLPEHMKNIDTIDKFKISLKTYLFNT